MKSKYPLLFFVLASFFHLSAQLHPGDDYPGRLYRLCKVWGYVKYFHSRVNSCQINWDSALVATIPLVEAAVDSNDFNAALLQMVQSAGPMSVATIPTPDLSAEVAINTDTTWISDNYFSEAIRDTLIGIRTNFRPTVLCNAVLQYPSTNSYWDFPGDSVAVATAHPTAKQRLLIAFRYWNIINYFSPNTQILANSWDSALLNNVLGIATANDSISFYKAFLKMQAALNDAHSELYTHSNSADFPGLYMPDLLVRYIEGSYIVLFSAYPSLKVGDIIDSVDGLSMPQWEDSLQPYISAGNLSGFREWLCNYGFLSGIHQSTANISFKDSTGGLNHITLTRTSSIFATWSNILLILNLKHWSKLSCNIGYVNMGKIQSSEIPGMYDSLKTSPAIIFDFRQYPNVSYSSILNIIAAGEFPFANLLFPDTTYPGYFYWATEKAGLPNNPSPYTGKIIMLMNYETMSAGEFDCMAFEGSKSLGQSIIKIGSETAGADGNVSDLSLSSDISTAFTSLGVYYPNGVNAQRRGILPDIEVYPTIAGIRAGNDELLDTAIAIACSLTNLQTVKQISDFKLFPNPASSIVSVTVFGNIDSLYIKITDLLGVTIRNLPMENQLETIDISELADGVYFVSIYDKNSNFVGSAKVIKQ